MPIYWLRPPLMQTFTCTPTAGSGGLTVTDTADSNVLVRYSMLEKRVWVNVVKYLTIGGAGTLASITFTLPVIQRGIPTYTATLITSLSSFEVLACIGVSGLTLEVRGFDGGDIPVSTGNAYYVAISGSYETP